MTKLRKNIIAQHLIGQGDKYGNPTSIYLIYDRKHTILGWIEQGYAGDWFKKNRNVKWLLSVNVSNKEINRFKHLEEIPNKEY
jgi:hypothetical protein